MSVEMRTMFSAITSRLTPAAAGSPVPSGEFLHENVVFGEPTEEQKSDRGSDEMGQRFSGEFNSVERPALSRPAQSDRRGETPTDSRLAYKGLTSGNLDAGERPTDHNFFSAPKETRFRAAQLSADYFSAPPLDPTVDGISVSLGCHDVQNVMDRD